MNGYGRGAGWGQATIAITIAVRPTDTTRTPKGHVAAVVDTL